MEKTPVIKIVLSINNIIYRSEVRKISLMNDKNIKNNDLKTGFF